MRLPYIGLVLLLAPTAEQTYAGSYRALSTKGWAIGDEQTSIVYFANTGELGVDAPAGTNLTSINIDSASGIFVNHDNAANLDGSFDTHSQNNIFKATFGTSFGSLSFGHVAQLGLSETFMANDLTVVGSLEGGGGLGDVDCCIPEPSAVVLAVLGLFGFIAFGRRMRLR